MIKPVINGFLIVLITTPAIALAGNYKCHNCATKKPVHHGYHHKHKHVQHYRGRAYVGAGVGTLKSGSQDLDAADVRLGYQFNPVWSAELQSGFSTEDHRDDKFVAGSLVGKSRGPVYGKVQVGYAQVDMDYGDSETGLAYGVGAGIRTRTGLSTEINYLKLPDNGHSDNEYLNLGIKYDF